MTVTVVMPVPRIALRRRARRVAWAALTPIRSAAGYLVATFRPEAGAAGDATRLLWAGLTFTGIGLGMVWLPLAFLAPGAVITSIAVLGPLIATTSRRRPR